MFHVCFNFPNSWRIWLPIGKLSILIREGKILFEIVVQGDWQSCSCYETMKNLFFSSEEITSLVCKSQKSIFSFIVKKLPCRFFFYFVRMFFGS